MTFYDMGLSPETLKAIEEVGYVTPTPIQEQAIPWVLQGRDVLGIAQTGTGKTASFTLPMIEILANGRAKARMPRSLILAPTRELANQVSENFTLYGKYHRLSMALLIGGESFTEQEKALDRGVDVLIATPGRLLDLFDRGRIILRDVKVLVIDEADRMLDMGFIPDVEKIVSKLPPLRQTLFFSATMDNQIKRLADAFLQNPKEIRVASRTSTAPTVTQHLVTVDVLDKREALRHIIRMEDVKNAFIFCNRKRDVGVLHRSLQKHGFDVCQFHGDMAQSERQATLNAFKAGSVRLMVCSDVAARGIDIADVSHVFNFDVPIHAEDYVHRIGRTGRAGKEGKAFTIASSHDGKFLAAIEKQIGKPIPPITLEGMATRSVERDGDTEVREPRSEGRGRGRSRSRSKYAPADDTVVIDKTQTAAPNGISQMTEPTDHTPDQADAAVASVPVVETLHDQVNDYASDPVVEQAPQDEAPATPREHSRSDRPRGDRSRYDRPREDRPREDRPREDRPREDRPREDRPREDRNRDDRYGRNNNKGRRDHPARDVDAMNYGDDVLAFGGYTPAFMLVETTQYSGPLADLPEGYEEEEILLAAVETPVEDVSTDEAPAVEGDVGATETDASPAKKARRSRRRRTSAPVEGDESVVIEATETQEAIISEEPAAVSDAVEAVAAEEPVAKAPRRRRSAKAVEPVAVSDAAPDVATPEAVANEEAAPKPRRRAPRKKVEAAPDVAVAEVASEPAAPVSTDEASS